MMLAIHNFSNIKVKIITPSKWISNFVYNTIRLSSNLSSSGTSDSSDSSDSDSESNNKNQKQVKGVIDDKNQTNTNEVTDLYNFIDNLFNKTPPNTADIKVNKKNNEKKQQEKDIMQIAEALSKAVGGDREKILSSLFTFSNIEQKMNLKESIDESSSNLKIENKSNQLEKKKRVQFFNIDIENNKSKSRRNKYKSRQALETTIKQEKTKLKIVPPIQTLLEKLHTEGKHTEESIGQKLLLLKTEQTLQKQQKIKTEQVKIKQEPQRLSIVKELLKTEQKPQRLSIVEKLLKTEQKPQRLSIAKELLKTEQEPQRLSTVEELLKTEQKPQRPSIVKELLKTEQEPQRLSTVEELLKTEQKPQRPSIVKELLKTEQEPQRLSTVEELLKTEQKPQRPSIVKELLKTEQEPQRLSTVEELLKTEQKPQQPSIVKELLKAEQKSQRVSIVEELRKTKQVKKEQEPQQPSIAMKLRNTRIQQVRKEQWQPSETQTLLEKQQIREKYGKPFVIGSLKKVGNNNYKSKMPVWLENTHKWTILNAIFCDDDIENIQRYEGEMKKYPPIFSITGVSPSNTVEFKTWDSCETKYMKLLTTSFPKNGFQEMIQWTEEKKLWRFPIDNEQGMEEEHKIHFSEHVFLERHLTGWCPSKGPIRHFMELVCVGLSQNPYLTVKEKYDHIMWYKEYFENKNDLLNKLGLVESTQCNTEKQITSN